MKHVYSDVHMHGRRIENCPNTFDYEKLPREEYERMKDEGTLDPYKFYVVTDDPGSFVQMGTFNEHAGDNTHLTSEQRDRIAGAVQGGDYVRLFDIPSDNFDAQVAIHNSIIRGKVLTEDRTISRILTDLANNDISDIFAGDIIEADMPAITETGYAAKSKEKFVILEINGLANCGVDRNKPQGNHLVMCPLDSLGTAKMNSTKTTVGGYKESNMNQTIMPAVATVLESVFGTHLMTTHELISNAVDTTLTSKGYTGFTGASSGYERAYLKCRLMNELEVYGSFIFSSSCYDATLNKQFAAFRNEKFLNRGFSWWLSAVASTENFAIVGADGNPSCFGASSFSFHLRPRFTIQ